MNVGERVLGLVGILGGVVLLVPLVTSISHELNVLRLVLFNLGAIAVIVGVHRRQAPVRRGLSVAAAGPAILANCWFLVMVVLDIGRPHLPAADPEFRIVLFFASVAMWWTDAIFGLVALRIGVVGRWGAIALAVGSVLAFTGIDRLGLVFGPLASIFKVVALSGIALNGIGWILLGIGLMAPRRAGQVGDRFGSGTSPAPM